jgi:hypothetical protein
MHRKSMAVTYVTTSSTPRRGALVPQSNTVLQPTTISESDTLRHSFGRAPSAGKTYPNLLRRCETHLAWVRGGGSRRLA